MGGGGWGILSIKNFKSVMLSFKNEGEINTFLNTQKLRKFITIRPISQEILKGVL